MSNKTILIVSWIWIWGSVWVLCTTCAMYAWSHEIIVENFPYCLECQRARAAFLGVDFKEYLDGLNLVLVESEDGREWIEDKVVVDAVEIPSSEQETKSESTPQNSSEKKLE